MTEKQAKSWSHYDWACADCSPDRPPLPLGSEEQAGWFEGPRAFNVSERSEYTGVHPAPA